MLQNQLDEVRLLLSRARELFGDTAVEPGDHPPAGSAAPRPQRMLP